MKFAHGRRAVIPSIGVAPSLEILNVSTVAVPRAARPVSAETQAMEIELDTEVAGSEVGRMSRAWQLKRLRKQMITMR